MVVTEQKNPELIQINADEPETVVVDERCDQTRATINMLGLTPRGACPTIYSSRSRRCACGKLGPNGKYRATKNCCGKAVK